MKKLAVLFPGIGYHTDKPLMYYSKKIAKEKGYDVIEINYENLPNGAKEHRDVLLEIFRIASAQIEEKLKDVDMTAYDEVLFICKSLGTILSPVYAKKHHINARYIYYTPVEDSFKNIWSPEGIVFHGTNDAWIKTDLVKEKCKQLGLPLYLTEGADHSMETGHTMEDISNLQKIMQQTEAYMK